jgi:hypothetical protein
MRSVITKPDKEDKGKIELPKHEHHPRDPEEDKEAKKQK